MKRKITKLLMTMLLAIVAAWSVQAAEFTVTSQGDDGTEGSGTLRDLITNKTGSNTIIIPEGYVITVSDTIAIASKGITIIGEGAGATVQVTTPGTSPWRIFSIIAGASVRTITLKNLTLKGGSTSIGGIISFDRRVNLTIENCTLSDGNASNNGGALGASLTGDITVSIKKSIFKNNHGSRGAAIGLSSGEVEITGCYFKENIGVVGTNTNGRTFSAISFNASSGNIYIDNCTFEGNENTHATDGGSCFSGSVGSATSTARYYLTNCTFYNNKAARGAVYNYTGNMYIANCTFAGNIATSDYGRAIYLHTTTEVPTKTLTLVNNILAYNYGGSRGDLYVGAYSTISGSKNIIALQNITTNNVTNTIVDPVAFAYNTSDPDNDPILFAAYTTVDGKKIPVIDSISPTLKVIPLAENSIAQNTGTASYEGVTIPTVDQRDSTRAATPCLGAYEYIIHKDDGGDDNPTGLLSPAKRSSPIVQNPASGYLLLGDDAQISSIQIVDPAGKILLSETLPSASISLSGIPAGIYIVRLETAKGVSIEKLIVK